MNEMYVMGFETEVAYRQQQLSSEFDHHEGVLMHWIRSHRMGHRTRSPHARSTGQSG